METRVVKFNGTREELLSRIYALPENLASDSTYGEAARRAIGSAILATFAEEFLEKSAGGTDRFGIAWLPLAEFTVDKKGNDVILIESKSDLYQSLANDGKAGGILETPGGKIEIGSAVPYASFHQLGFTVVPGSPIRLGDKIIGVWKKDAVKVAPRPFIPTADQLTDEWAEDVFNRAAPQLLDAALGALGAA